MAVVAHAGRGCHYVCCMNTYTDTDTIQDMDISNTYTYTDTGHDTKTHVTPTLHEYRYMHG